MLAHDKDMESRHPGATPDLYSKEIYSQEHCCMWMLLLPASGSSTFTEIRRERKVPLTLLSPSSKSVMDSNVTWVLKVGRRPGRVRAQDARLGFLTPQCRESIPIKDGRDDGANPQHPVNLVTP